ncbi:MAG: hypothetical protein ABEK50_10870 [bacterium]
MTIQSEQSPNYSSEKHEVETEQDAVEELMSAGKTDGLPVVPPTPERVRSMFSTIHFDPDDILGTIPERRRRITAEKVAINAVMAGCEPEHFPVVIAAVQAILDPRYSIHGPSASTAGPAVLTVVNGPIVEELGFRSKDHLFAPGNRANATVGRAINLVLRNTAGSTIDEFDRACFSHPGRYSYCIAENTSASPWSSFHVERGFDADDSTVTVFAAEAPNQVANNSGGSAEAVLSTIAGRMAAPGVMGLGFDSEVVVVLGQEHTGTILEDDFDKQDVREFLAREAFMTLEEAKECGMLPNDVEEGDDEIEVPLVNDPSNVYVLTAGGEAGPFSVVIPGWTGRDNCQAITVGIPGHAKEAACELPDYKEDS